MTFTGCDKEEPIKIKVIDIPLTEEVEYYGFAIAKSNTTLLGYANELIKELKTSGELDEIIISFNNGTNEFTYSNPTIPKDAKKLTVATNAYFEPFEYFIDETTFSGIDIYLGYLLAQKLSQKTGETYYLYIESIKFENIIESIATKEYDIGMAGISITPARLESVAFSDSYFDSYQVIFTKSDDDTFANCKNTDDIDTLLKTFDKNYIVGVQSKTTGQDIMEGKEESYSGYKNLTVKGFVNGEDAASALIKGDINAVVLDVFTAKHLAKK